MDSQQRIDIARTLIGTGKGPMAIYESNPTCDKRFAKLGIPQMIAARRDYRELIITTAGLGEDISGVILYDETIRQQKKDGASFLDVSRDAGIIAGRASQQPALGILGGEETHRSAAQHALRHRAQCNRAASRGEDRVAMERT